MPTCYLPCCIECGFSAPFSLNLNIHVVSSVRVATYNKNRCELPAVIGFSSSPASSQRQPIWPCLATVNEARLTPPDSVVTALFFYTRPTLNIRTFSIPRAHRWVVFPLLHINLPRTLEVVLSSWYRLITCPLSPPFWYVFSISTGTGSTASTRFLLAYLLAVCHLHKVRMSSIHLQGVGGTGVTAPSLLSACVQPSLRTISFVAGLIVVGVTLMERFLTRGRGSLLKLAVRNIFYGSRY